MMYYVYEYWDPIENYCFYVGKGRSKDSRARFHLNQAKLVLRGEKDLLSCSNQDKILKIIDLLNKSIEPKIVIVFRSDNEIEAIVKEKTLIETYGRKNIGTGLLLNKYTEGSEFKHSIEHRNKLKEYNPGGIATSIPIYQIDLNGKMVKW